MSEPKVLHEFTHDGVKYSIVEDEFCRMQAIATFLGAEIVGLPEAMWKRASMAEILLLAAALSAAEDRARRAENFLSGVRRCRGLTMFDPNEIDTDTHFALAMDRTVWESVLTAASERKLQEYEG